MADTLLPQPTANPVLSEIMGLSPQAKTALGMAGHTVQPPQPDVAPISPIRMPDSGPPQLGAPALPNVVAPRGTVQGDTNERGRLLNSGPGEDSIYHSIANSGFGQNHPFLGKLLGGLAEAPVKIADIAASTVAPELTANIPGTFLHHSQLLGQANTALAGSQKAAQNTAQTEDTESQTGLRNAQTEYNEARPDIEQGKIDQKTQAAQDKIQSTQATTDLHKAQSDMASARKDYLEAQKNNLPKAMELAQARINVARQNATTAVGRLGLSSREFAFNQDKTYNPEPTSKERSTGDLAQSAVNQVHTMRGIINAHPDMFGPGGAAKQELQRWLSSDAEDAGKFLAARDYLAEHSAGVFGGRGQYIIKQLQDITNPNFNPSALHGALDQAEQTAQHFVKAGTTHGKGETGGAAGNAEGFINVQIPGQPPGQIHPSQKAAFLAKYPNAKVVQ